MTPEQLAEIRRWVQQDISGGAHSPRSVEGRYMAALLAEIEALTQKEENWEGILASELDATRELWDELGLTVEQFEHARTNSHDATLEAIRELKASNARLAGDVARLRDLLQRAANTPQRGAQSITEWRNMVEEIQRVLAETAPATAVAQQEDGT